MLSGLLKQFNWDLFRVISGSQFFPLTGGLYHPDGCPKLSLHLMFHAEQQAFCVVS